MARLPAPLATIQSNDEAFASTVEKIKRATASKLSRFGLVSHTSMYEYVKRKPVDQSTEDAIIASLELYVRSKVAKTEEIMERVHNVSF